jgi:hypothetical protein
MGLLLYSSTKVTMSYSYSNLSDLEAAVKSAEAAMDLAEEYSDTDAGYRIYSRAVQAYYCAVDTLSNTQSVEKAKEEANAASLAAAIAYDPNVSVLEAAADAASYRIKTSDDYKAYEEAVRVFFDAVDKALADKAVLDSIVEKAIAASRATTAAILEEAIAASRAATASTLEAAIAESRAATAAILAKYSI